MPEFVPEMMDAEREKQLRAWLNKTECNSLKTVISSKSRWLQEKALIECFASTGSNGYDLKSISSMKEAQRYETFLDVLREVINQTGPFQILKAKQ